MGLAQSIIDAVKGVASGNEALAMLTGAGLESGGDPSAAGDGSYGAWQFQDGAAPEEGTIAEYDDPAWEAAAIAPRYAAATAAVAPSLWQSNPELAAEEAAYGAERPSVNYYQGQGTAAVDAAYGDASSALSGDSGSPGGSSSGAIGQVLDFAQGWVNQAVPYKWGGVNQFGADCSGYVKGVFQEAGYVLPRTSEQQATVGVAVPLKGSGGLGGAEPGDILLFDYGATDDHVALYAGGNENYVEATTGTDAALNPVDSSALTGIRRIISSSGDPEPGITTTTDTAIAGPDGDVTGSGADYTAGGSGQTASLDSFNIWGFAKGAAGAVDPPLWFGANAASGALHDFGTFKNDAAGAASAAGDAAGALSDVGSVFETVLSDGPSWIIRALEVCVGWVCMGTAFTLLGICLASKGDATVTGTAGKAAKLGAMVAAPEAAPELEGAGAATKAPALAAAAPAPGPVAGAAAPAAVLPADKRVATGWAGEETTGERAHARAAGAHNRSAARKQGLSHRPALRPLADPGTRQSGRPRERNPMAAAGAAGEHDRF